MKFLRAPFFYRTPPEAASGRPFWMRPLFADRATSGAYRSLLLEMKETERQKNMGLFACHQIDLTIYWKAFDYKKECSYGTHATRWT